MTSYDNTISFGNYVVDLQDTAVRAKFAVEANRELYKSFLAMYHNPEFDRDYITDVFLDVIKTNIIVKNIFNNWCSKLDNPADRSWKTCLRFMNYMISHSELVTHK